ncbi:MAG TPA: glycine--tRNA ligase subunit beta [Thermoanaerobaculia bacterium]|nr:glycine--tRNA ligase subunit beta [Thermoanaerobaculia bacterium]
MAEYLLEVRAEEIPARMLEPAVRRLATRVFEELMGRGLGPREVETGFTPRRLVLVLGGLPAAEPDREERVVGPPASVAFDAEGRPTKALEGFARKLGIDPGALERIATDKGEYVAAVQAVRGRAAAEVLAEVVPQALVTLPWPKTMRWGAGRGPWVRPVHGIVSLLDREVVPFELFGVAAGDRTSGHPVLSPGELPVTDAAGYREALAERGIEVDPRERSRRLAGEMARRAAAAGGALVEDPELLARLAAMCEIPGVMEGAFDERYLELPREVLITSLKDHQSAFTVERDGRLLPRFLTVMDRPDDPAGRVRAGNEWVVEARLADARFFYGEDRKRPLAERAAELEHLAFHARLGSYAAKTERLAGLADWLAGELGWREERPDAERAARLLKLDLVTEMVKEFTSLQGVMGGIYAREDGEPEAVWQAVYDQYRPAGTEDPLPRGRAGLAVALADRFDTLVGLFGLGQVPTGSRDPFGLRRAAQGAVRIALERELPLDLAALAREAARLYGDALPRNADEILADLRPFLDDRVRHLLGLRGYAYDEIEAGLAAEGVQDLPDLEARVAALHRVRDEPAFLSVVLAAKRIANIVPESPAPGEPAAPDPARFETEAEAELHREAGALSGEVEDAAARRDYEGALRRIAELAEVLERFFVEVLVMAEDEGVRANRLALLRATGGTLSRVARLTEMVVDREEHRKRSAE